MELEGTLRQVVDLLESRKENIDRLESRVRELSKENEALKQKLELGAFQAVADSCQHRAGTRIAESLLGRDVGYSTSLSIAKEGDVHRVSSRGEAVRVAVTVVRKVPEFSVQTFVSPELAKLVDSMADEVLAKLLASGPRHVAFYSCPRPLPGLGALSGSLPVVGELLVFGYSPMLLCPELSLKVLAAADVEGLGGGPVLPNRAASMDDVLG